MSKITWVIIKYSELISARYPQWHLDFMDIYLVLIKTPLLFNFVQEK